MEARASAAESSGRTFQKLRGTTPKCKKGAAESQRPFSFLAAQSNLSAAASRRFRHSVSAFDTRYRPDLLLSHHGIRNAANRNQLLMRRANRFVVAVFAHEPRLRRKIAR